MHTAYNHDSHSLYWSVLSKCLTPTAISSLSAHSTQRTTLGEQHQSASLSYHSQLRFVTATVTAFSMAFNRPLIFWRLLALLALFIQGACAAIPPVHSILPVVDTLDLPLAYATHNLPMYVASLIPDHFHLLDKHAHDEFALACSARCLRMLRDLFLAPHCHAIAVHLMQSNTMQLSAKFSLHFALHMPLPPWAPGALPLLLSVSAACSTGSS